MSRGAAPTGLTLDAGALTGVDRDSEILKTILREAVVLGLPIAIPAGALAQVWRDGTKQARLARFVKSGMKGDSAAPTVVPLHEQMAKQAGVLCGLAGTTDVVDASVVLVARLHGHAVVTSDPGDLAKLDPMLPLIIV